MLQITHFEGLRQSVHHSLLPIGGYNALLICRHFECSLSRRFSSCAWITHPLQMTHRRQLVCVAEHSLTPHPQQTHRARAPLAAASRGASGLCGCGHHRRRRRRPVWARLGPRPGPVWVGAGIPPWLSSRQCRGLWLAAIHPAFRCGDHPHPPRVPSAHFPIARTARPFHARCGCTGMAHTLTVLAQ